LVEAGTGPKGRWSVGFARLSDKLLQVEHDGIVIWNYDPQGPEPRMGGANHPFVVNSLESRHHLLSPE